MLDTTLENIQEKWTPTKIHNVILSLQPGFACGKRDDNGYVQLRMNNIGLEGRIITNSFLKVPKSETNLDKYVLKNGDVIFNNTNSPELVGKTVLFRGELDNCVYSNHLTRIRINKDLITPEFVTHFLRFEQRKGTFQLLCRRFVGQAAVPRESLLDLDLLLPPLNEQKRIVSKIEEFFKESRIACEALDKIPPIMKKFKQSILSSAFRGELVSQDSQDESAEKLLEKIKQERRKKWEESIKSKGKDLKKFKYENPQPVDANDLPELSENIIWTSIGDVETFVGSGITPLGGKSIYVKEGIPFIRSQNVYPDGLHLDDVAYITKKLHEEMSRTHVQPGDVLLNITGASIGRSTFVPDNFGPANVNQHVCIIRTGGWLIPKYLSYWLNSPSAQDKIFSTETGVTREGLNYSQIRSLPLPYTSPKNQIEIVKKIDELFSLANAMEHSVEEAKSRADKIDFTILAKAFRGELVSQDPDDEPASVLLERIKSEREKSEQKLSKSSRKKMVKKLT